MFDGMEMLKELIKDKRREVILRKRKRRRFSSEECYRGRGPVQDKTLMITE
jgi:predicted nucleic acid-binding OB-fold protein